MNRYEFSPSERKTIYERDNYKCVMPNCNRKMLGVAHVFYPRSKGGLGIKENGVLLCQFHHFAFDSHDSNTAEYVEKHCKDYLHNKHDFKENDLKYNKWKNFKYNK